MRVFNTNRSIIIKSSTEANVCASVDFFYENENTCAFAYFSLLKGDMLLSSSLTLKGS
jgi:hypothetical protein